MDNFSYKGEILSKNLSLNMISRYVTLGFCDLNSYDIIPDMWV